MATITITKRIPKGSALTHKEMDDNFQAVTDLQIDSASFSQRITTDSQSFSDRITNDSQSFSQRITTDSASFDFRINLLSSSYEIDSASFSERITTDSASFSFRITSDSSSFSQRITSDSSSFSIRVTENEDDLAFLFSKTLHSGSIQVDHDQTTGFVANEHINHGLVNITAGSGLIGGGNITTTRTLNIGQGPGITVNADDIQLATTSAGAGLTYNNGVLAVGSGTGVTVEADLIKIGQPVGTTDTVQFGLVRSTGDVVAFYSSDERLKDNITILEDSLEKIKRLGGYEFDWNEKQDVYEGHDIGVIAQEVEPLFPELVQTREDGYKAVKYEKLVPVLIEAVKELSRKVERLENKVL